MMQVSGYLHITAYQKGQQLNYMVHLLMASKYFCYLSVISKINNK